MSKAQMDDMMTLFEKRMERKRLQEEKEAEEEKRRREREKNGE